MQRYLAGGVDAFSAIQRNGHGESGVKMKTETNENEVSDRHYAKLLSDTIKRDLDNFFVHQFIVRRFMFENEDVYHELMALRVELEVITEEIFDDRLVRDRVVFMLMNMMQNKRLMQLLAENNTDECITFLQDNLDTDVSSRRLPLMDIKELFALDWRNDLEGVVGFLRECRETVQTILKSSNLFRYYGLYSMTVLIDFKRLLQLQGVLAENKYIYGYFDSAPSYAKWLAFNYDELLAGTDQVASHPEFADLLRGLYCLKNMSGMFRKFNSKNILIRDDEFSQTIVDGEVSTGRIHLSIPYDELPVDIDSALKIVRNVLSTRLMEKGFYRYQEKSNDFWSSSFFTARGAAAMINQRGRSKTILFAQPESYYKLVLGLLMWDTVKLENNTIERSIESISGFLQDQAHLDASIRARNENLKNDYDYAATRIKSDSVRGKEFSKALSKVKAVTVR